MILANEEVVGETRRLHPRITSTATELIQRKQAPRQTLLSQRSSARLELFRLKDFT
jgi:hypothetical protein